MKNQLACYPVVLFFILFSFAANAQNFPGKIIKAAATADLKATNAFPAAATGFTGSHILDPDGNGIASVSVTGFSNGNDVAGSEVNYKPIVPYSVEPYGDLRRGPSHMFSDFVPGVDNASYYMYYRSAPAGTEALQFRIRMGTITPGAKGYSILLDTDGRFGAAGATADPNYKAATTGTNGNAGFEIEIDLFTQTSGQTGIAIYNVDGIDNPTTPVWSATNWQAYAQVSLAATSDNGDPDFFLDFFVPFNKLASLGVTAATELRAVATTVMAPLPAIGGPKSDIYGLSDSEFKDPNSQFEAFINSQPSFTPTTLGAAGTTSPTSNMCTAAPSISSVTMGSANNGMVKGVWVKNNLSVAATAATITIYKTTGGTTTTLGTVTATSGDASGWTLPNVTINAGDVITAKAQASNESMCQVSNALRATNCNSNTIPATPLLTCASGSKGTGGTNFTAGYTIHLQNISRGTAAVTASAQGTTGDFVITGNSWTYSKGCQTGSPMVTGTYKIWYTNADGCASDPAYFCAGTASGIVPSVSVPAGAAFTTATTGISGSAQAGSVVSLYVNRVLLGSANADAATGAFAFPNASFTNAIKLTVTDNVYLVSEFNNGTSGSINTSACAASTQNYNVTCFTPAPVITSNTNNQLTIGQPIKGTAATNAQVKVYNAVNTLLATATALADGTWSTTGAVFSNGFNGNTVAGTTYYATSTLETCVSASSATVATALAAPNVARCGTITATVPASAPLKITSVTTTVSGTLGTAVTGTTVWLYQDDELVGSTLTSGSTWTIDVTNKLYASSNAFNGKLSLRITEQGTAEVYCPATYTVVANCNAPVAPTVTPLNAQTVPNGGNITYTIQDPIAGVFYSLSDETTGRELTSGVWATSAASPITMTTKPINITTTAVVKAVQMTATGEVCLNTTSRSITILPITLLEFKGRKEGTANELTWRTAAETNASRFELEKSADGVVFKKIGTITATGRGSIYSYTDNAVQPISYYRLKLVDLDDKFKYSHVIVLRDNNVTLQATAHPNPFYNKVKISFSLLQPQQVQIVLADGAGRIVYSKQAWGSKGINNFTIDNLEALPEGFYVLRINAVEGQWQEKLLKTAK